jgi:23S rRNA maturation mini-RNase III
LKKLSPNKNFNINEMSVLTLAFLGDAVFNLVVCENIILNNDYNLKDTNKAKIQMVCCKSQSNLVDRIINNFYNEERIG